MKSIVEFLVNKNKLEIKLKDIKDWCLIVQTKNCYQIYETIDSPEDIGMYYNDNDKDNPIECKNTIMNDIIASLYKEMNNEPIGNKQVLLIYTELLYKNVKEFKIQIKDYRVPHD